MHGTILHYDPMTQCGLLRTPAGQVQYFRVDEVTSDGPLRAGYPVALRQGVLVDTGGSRVGATAAPQPAPTAPANVPVRPQPVWGWLGSVLAGGALVLLLLAGGQYSGFGSPLPRLIESVFGLIAAVLLVVLAVLFLTNQPRGRLRWAYWLVVLLSAIAYVGQTFDGFEADQPTNWYGYTLFLLGFAVYVLPYRK